MTDRQKRVHSPDPVTSEEAAISHEKKPKSKKVDLSFAETLKEHALKKFGTSSVKGFDDFLKCVWGVPIHNNLALQYLLGVDVIPLGRMINVVGPFGVTKSNFCWYLATLFIRVGGYVPFIDSERKSNPDQTYNLLKTYLNLPEDPDSWFCWNPVENLDELLDYNVYYVKQIREMGGKACGRPVFLLNDSLGSVTSEEAGDKRMDDEDIQGFSAARNAAKLSEDMQVFGPRMAELPVTGCFINHQKVKIQQEGQRGRASYLPPIKSEKGGEHQRFAYSLIVEINELRKDKVVRNGVTLQYPCFKFTTKKNALGSKRPYIEVPYRYLWKGDTEGTEKIWYDFDASLTLLLTDETLLAKSLVKEVLDIKYERGRYSSNKLGVEGLTDTEFGKAIHSNAQIVQELQDKVLCIRRKDTYGTLIPGIDRTSLCSELEPAPEADAGEAS